MPRAPDKAVTPLVPPGLSHPATHVSVASLHIDVHPRLPDVMAEHPRSQKQELQPLKAQQQRSLHSLWTEPATCQLRFKEENRLYLSLGGASWMTLVVQNPPANAGDVRDVGSIPGSGRSHGEGNGNLLQYSCLENPMDRRAWWATVRGVAKLY